MSSQPLALVTENDASTRRLLNVLLSRVGVESDIVANGADALLLLEHVEYDLLIVNLLLPGTNGTDVLNWLASARSAALPRTIVLSSAPETHLQRVRQRWPQLRTMRKPFELGELLEAATAIVATPVERTLTPADEFCRRSVQAGAKAGVIVRVRGETVEPVLTYGYTPDQVAPFLSMMLDDPYPICKTIRERKPIWCASVAHVEAEFPVLAPVWSGNQSRAFATVPIVSGTEAVGAVGWTYNEPRLFNADEQQRLLDIAARVGEMVAPSGDVVLASKPA